MIAWFARNSVAANLLLVAICVAGVISINKLPLDVFPEFDPNRISISVPLRGATPEDVELGIAVRIEEAVQDLPGIERMVSESVEGSTRLTIEVDSDYDPREMLDDIKTRVDAINTFPAEAERPVISLNIRQFDVIEAVVSGTQSAVELLSFAEQVRDDLMRINGISFAEIDSVQNYEIAIEASQDRLREYQLTLADLNRAIQASSVDLSAGNVRTVGGDVLIRSKGQAYRGSDFADIVVKTNRDGSIIRLGDLATVIDGFEEGGATTRFNGDNAVFIGVRRTGNESAIDVAAKVHEYIASKQASLPNGMKLSFWDDDSVQIRDRLGILARSALQGSVLVILLLALFLRPSVAFWVFLGIPVSFLGGFAMLSVFDMSLNLMSAFGFIIVLGIVVDDAIVTGENVYRHLRAGNSGLKAAIHGTQQVAVPVTFGVLTTVAAFAPLAFIEGRLGSMMGPMAMVVIPVLLFSLIESKFVLPAHLKHIKVNANNPDDNAFVRWQMNFADGFERWIMKYYEPALDKAIRYRYATLAVFVGVLVLIGSLLSAGWTRYTFFPSIEGETATATLQMPVGTPFEVTDEHIQRMVAAAEQLQREYTNGEDGDSLITNILSVSGVSGRSPASHAGRVRFEVMPRKDRIVDMATSDLNRLWRQQIGAISGAESLTFRSRRISAGSPIDVQLSGNSLESLSQVAEEVKERIAAYAGVYEIEDSQSDGKEEIEVKLKPQAYVLGLTRNDVVGQVGEAFRGLQAQRIQRGRDDIRVIVRFSGEERRSIETLNEMLIVANDGRAVPLSSVATLIPSRGPSQITRIDQYRTVNITAEVDKESVNMTVLQDELTADLDALMAAHPGIAYTLEGENREREKSMASLVLGFTMVLFAIYCLLALPLKSYTQPLIVMTVIPMGAIGAILGHLLMGYHISFFSLLGLLALSGVVINDSLVLVDYVNQQHRAGKPLAESIRRAGVTRFRPVMLTSLTTFIGLMPLLLEKSSTAQFLIPMAISLGFGILFATMITLFLIPINLMAARDLRNILRRGFERTKATLLTNE